jgi:hypothetical protein
MAGDFRLATHCPRNVVVASAGHLTTACTRPRIAQLSSARLGRSVGTSAAGDAGRYALVFVLGDTKWIQTFYLELLAQHPPLLVR